MVTSRSPLSVRGLLRALASAFALVAVIVMTYACGGNSPLTSTPLTTASAQASLATTSPSATPSPTPISFVSSLYGYSVVLPPGWAAHEPGADEDFFESPTGDVTLTMGSGQPEPGQTVADRVRINRAEEFGGCETDPSTDRQASVGGEPGILWSFRCDQTAGLAANTIHNGTGYRLTLKTTDTAAHDLEAIMLGLLRDFRFRD
jgi:hypothetical protein